MTEGCGVSEPGLPFWQLGVIMLDELPMEGPSLLPNTLIARLEARGGPQALCAGVATLFSAPGRATQAAGHEQSSRAAPLPGERCSSTPHSKASAFAGPRSPYAALGQLTILAFCLAHSSTAIYPPLCQREDVKLGLLPPWKGRLRLSHYFLQLCYLFLWPRDNQGFSKAVCQSSQSRMPSRVKYEMGFNLLSTGMEEKKPHKNNAKKKEKTEAVPGMPRSRPLGTSGIFLARTQALADFRRLQGQAVAEQGF